MAEVTLDQAMRVMDNVDVMLGYWDRDLRCRFANSAYRIWFGKSRNELIGIHMRELLGPLFEKNLPYIEGVLRGEPQLFEREIPVPDGSIRHSLASYYPDFAEDGSVQGFTVQVTNVTKLKELEHELKEAKELAETLATHDFLTGLPNRVLLMRGIEAAVAKATRRGTVAGIAVLDLDGFKNINDTYGHDAGDRVLKAVATRILGTIRVTDTATRLGGDEFILVIEDVESEVHVVQILERVLCAVDGPVDYDGASLAPKASCGVAFVPRHGIIPTELMATADRALYAAKRQGKGRIVVA